MLFLVAAVTYPWKSWKRGGGADRARLAKLLFEIDTSGLDNPILPAVRALHISKETDTVKGMAKATLTSKGQITIPKEVRERLGVDSGDRLEFVEQEPGVYKVVAATKDIRHLKGLVPKPRRPVSVEEMKAAVRRARGRK